MESVWNYLAVNARGALEVSALLLSLVAMLVLLRRRQGAPSVAELEDIELTAERITAPNQLDEIVVTAARLPETWATRTVDAISTAAGQVFDAIKGAVMPRGIRNNNPGNLERTGIRWKGMSAQQTDPRFVVFEAPHWGVRALGRVLKTYAGRGLVTVRDIINTWAPSHENDTGAYVAAVARALEVAPDERIDVATRLPELAAAIIRQENGKQPYSAADIAAWVRLA